MPYLLSETMQNSWLKRFDSAQYSPTKTVRLFCFPYAGGGSQIFRSWPEYLAPQVDVIAIELPGRGMRFRELAFTHMAELVEALVNIVHPYLDQPFVLFGHSMGGLIAFELTHALSQRGQPPLHLIVSGRSAPQCPSHTPPIHRLPDVDFIEKIRSMNGTPSQLLESDAFRTLFLSVLRSDFKLIETYQYVEHREPLNTPLTVFGGLEDTEAAIANLSGWQTQTRQSFSLQCFPGDHFFLHSAQTDVLESISHILMMEKAISSHKK